MIDIIDLTVGYRKNVPVLKNFSLSVRQGEIVNILGPNGCGKSTLLKSLLGFLPVPPKTLFVSGDAVETIKRHDLARRLSYVPQFHHGVFPYQALDVVLMGRSIHSPWLRFSQEDKQAAYSALEKVKMAHLAKSSYLELSGGQRQLVLIARALAQKSACLIMDEPASGLDYGYQFHLLDVIRDLSQDGLAVILSTHSPVQALYLGGRAVLIKDGVLVADGVSSEVMTEKQVQDLYGLSRETLTRVNTLTTV